MATPVSKTPLGGLALRLVQNGVLDEATWDSYQRAIPTVLGTERTRDWWNTLARGFLAPAFVKMVDALIEDHPLIDLHQQLVDWK